MPAICIVDTSVFCNLLNVPRRNQRHAATLAQLKGHLNDRDELLLPLATIFETGNHIAQNGDGRQRRDVADVFARQVREALTGESPFTPTQVPSSDALIDWLDHFPNHAGAGVGFGDLSIIRLFEETCVRHPARRVLIWAYDKHLTGYDRPQTL